ncbi:SCO family protein [Modestobacter sp. VKM Ac-2986]|uniref:SCO family protein n=1 Tax=Modestobacter sp. VKM Ac-2986 TaxID=3004140 RepID=UPI0022AB8DDC|nr:SCO family protein [Modestobacter sp. VKM Ac-2986]MCZ2830512.1 SCO family protein [Modestobacter sp. VKM Ac-2986]
MSSANRTGLTALALAAGLLLAGCGGDADADTTAQGHDHGGAAAPATVADDGASPYSGLHLQDPYQKPEFTLTDGTGAPFDFAERTAAGPTLLFFGFTNCPDVCPTTMADVTLALRTVDPAVVAATTVVFVTTDPARDTPEVLEEYLDRFDADLGTAYVGLTGDQAQIDQAQLAAGVPLAEDDGQTHSAMLLLYGTDGEADVAFNGGNTATDIAHDLAVVAAE